MQTSIYLSSNKLFYRNIPSKAKLIMVNAVPSDKAMCADYGFRCGTGRLYQEGYGKMPKSVWKLATDNLIHEIHQPDALNTPEFKEIKSRIDSLNLNLSTIKRVEHDRINQYGEFQSSAFVKIPFYALCWVLDIMYKNKPIQKFWVLETVARIPYFAYISILHLYESLGLWRAGAKLRQVHFAQEWNELHHLQIMESLGGDRVWFDRFIAQHAALFYYWVMIAYYLVSPKDAYNFMQRVEHHAADTYAAFINNVL